MDAQPERRRAAAAAPRQLSGRGLAYWTDGRESASLRHARLPAGRARREDRRPFRLRQNGIVDLKLDNDQEMDPITGEIGLHAAPVVAGDMVIIGAAHLPAACREPTQREGLRPRFDVRTGKRLWIFHTIPRPGEFGNETW